MKPVAAVIAFALLCGAPALAADADDPQLPSLKSLLGEAQAALTRRPDVPSDLRAARPGDGRPVLVFPAFLAGDWQTEPLRDFLGGKGYAVYGWNLGSNLGPTDFTLKGMAARLDEVRAQNRGAKVTLIGHSLGGVLARELAKMRPDAVRQVIVLASPIRKPTASLLVPLYEALSVFYGDNADALESRLNEPPSVPVTAVYTRTDGIIAWESSLERPGPRRENVEVTGAHTTMARNFDAWRIILDRLRLGATWRPYSGAPTMEKAAL